MFLRECLLRNVGEAKTHVIYELTRLGYPAMYMKFENNVGGNNMVCEGQTWHCTDSNNKPHCIDCGENEDLFLALAALRDDSDKYQWFIYNSMDCTVEKLRDFYWFKCEEDKIEDMMYWDCAYLNCTKATVEELIEHFK